MNDGDPRREPLIRLTGVSMRYGSGEVAVDAIKDVDLTIDGSLTTMPLPRA